MSAGSRYLSRLNDGRKVWLNGKTVDDVAAHPAFKGAVETLAALLDLQDDPATADRLTFTDEKGKKANLAYLIPRSKADVERRREAFRLWSDHTFGLMSRLGEFSRSLLTGWYASRHRHDDGQLAEKLERYYLFSRDNDLLSTVAGHDPQTDRSKLASELDDPYVNVRIVKETEDGVIVRGAKMIATAAPYMDEFFVFPHYRRPQRDERYAIMFAVPANAPGLHIVCRESFAADRGYDHPASPYDEMDAVLVFDDVLVPWERVFIKDDPDAIWKLRTDPVPSLLSQHQTVVRLVSKLEFIVAVGSEIVEANGAAAFQHVQQKLGEMIVQLETIKGLLVAAEHRSAPREDGIWLPEEQALFTARNLGTRFYPRALEILQQVGAGGLLQLPAAFAELRGPIGPLLQKYYRGADRDAFERTRLFKLAWDLIGSSFASRHELYERFYSGDPVRTFAAQYEGYDKRPLLDAVWSFVDSIPVKG